MPFVSEKQKRFMYAKHSVIAKRWAKEGKSNVVKKKKYKKVLKGNYGKKK